MIIINIDVMLAKRKMSVTELSERVGITMANMSVLKNGKAKAVKIETLNKICAALDCQPGDILEYRNENTWIINNVLHLRTEQMKNVIFMSWTVKIRQKQCFQYVNWQTGEEERYGYCADAWIKYTWWAVKYLHKIKFDMPIDFFTNIYEKIFKNYLTNFIKWL